MKYILAFIICLIACGNSNQSYSVDGKVSSLFWENKIIVERFCSWKKESFIEHKPHNAFDIVENGKRFHHHKFVDDGVILMPQIFSGANGSITITYIPVSQGHWENVYETWLSYNVFDWGFNRQISKSGNGNNPAWPNEDDLNVNKNLAKDQQERIKKESKFIVKFSNDGKEYSYNTDEDNFRKFDYGQVYKLGITSSGIVYSVR